MLTENVYAHTVCTESKITSGYQSISVHMAYMKEHYVQIYPIGKYMQLLHMWRSTSYNARFKLYGGQEFTHNATCKTTVHSTDIVHTQMTMRGNDETSRQSPLELAE